MNMHENSLKFGSYTHAVLRTFRKHEPYTYFNPTSMALLVDTIPIEDADQIVVNAINNINRQSYLRETEAIVYVYGSKGYMWTPDIGMAQCCRPAGYRPDVFYGYPKAYQQALATLWETLRIVDIADDASAYPRVKESVYQDLRFFAEHMGQNISVHAYAEVLERDPITADQHIRAMIKLLKSIPNTGLTIAKSRGFNEYRLDLA